ncbi:blood group Rh(CE) polypeptide isoform X3 [Halichoerus grypus]|uniref:blood group Rh(CE) polypeptide isoform X3 n=1 Tax=Halichoerus grypus TaxID=9711 RepID=UPI001659F297|nr:blood group Rh(CE) polypeptide isoform X3 [Halichoerus grypus]
MPHRHRQGHRMGSKYPPSMRGCLPLWILVLEVALIVIFFFFTSSDTSSQDPKKLMGNFRVLQDVTIMAALGFGFLNSSLRRYGWSSVAFNLFLLALGVQWAVLMDGFLEWSFRKKVVIKLSSIKLATMSAMSVLISAGAVLGKANLLQLTSMALVEVTVFVTMRMIDRQYLSTHIHNAVLAGGVAVGPSCHLITSPWLAMLLGFMAGLISIGGALCLPEYFNHVLGIHDTCGVHYTFGLPGLLGGIAYILLIIYEVTWTKQSMISYQVFIGTGTLSLAVASGLIAGVLTGLVLNLKICKGPHAANYFDDQAFWEFPHLAIGF